MNHHLVEVYLRQMTLRHKFHGETASTTSAAISSDIESIPVSTGHQIHTCYIIMIAIQKTKGNTNTKTQTMTKIKKVRE